MSKAEIIHFLQNSGLVEILKRWDGVNQNRVWLYKDICGNTTFTFEEKIGQIGGEVIPVWALSGEKIHVGKVGAMEDYLLSFGLDIDEARAVIKTVGIFP